MPCSVGTGVFVAVSVTGCTVVLFHVRIRADSEKHRFARLYVFVELCDVIWNDVSDVGCRQSNCSYNVQSGFVE
jgi:hypothetical protein